MPLTFPEGNRPLGLQRIHRRKDVLAIIFNTDRVYGISLKNQAYAPHLFPDNRAQTWWTSRQPVPRAHSGRMAVINSGGSARGYDAIKLWHCDVS